MRRGYVSRHGKNFAIKFDGEVGGDETAACFGGFGYERAIGKSSHNAIADWKSVDVGMSWHWKFAQEQAALGDNFLGQGKIIARIDVEIIQAIAHDGDSFSVAVQRATMSDSVNAKRQPTDDAKTSLCKLLGKAGGHLLTIVREFSRAHHGKHWHFEAVQISFGIQ